MDSQPPFVKFTLRSGAIVLVDEQDAHFFTGRTWRVEKGSRVRGGGYVRAKIAGKQALLHRLIMDPPVGMMVDHINGDRLDNRRANLRICTRMQNLRNQHARHGGTSRWKGVSWNKLNRRWKAQISGGPGKTIHLGHFTCELCAARAYCIAALEQHGEFANFDEVPYCHHE